MRVRAEAKGGAKCGVENQTAEGRREAAENDMRAEYRAEIALYQEREAEVRNEMGLLREAVAGLLNSQDQNHGGEREEEEEVN